MSRYLLKVMMKHCPPEDDCVFTPVHVRCACLYLDDGKRSYKGGKYDSDSDAYRISLNTMYPYGSDSHYFDEKGDVTPLSRIRQLRQR